MLHSNDLIYIVSTCENIWILEKKKIIYYPLETVLKENKKIVNESI